MRNNEQLLFHINQLLTFALAVQSPTDMGRTCHRDKTTFTWRVLLNGPAYGVSRDTTWAKLTVLWALIHIKSKMGRASCLSKHYVRRKESSFAWNNVRETETLFWTLLALSPTPGQIYFPKMKAGIFHWIINSEMVFHHNVILLHCWICHLWCDIKSLFLTTRNLWRFKGLLLRRKSLVFKK